jgi:hypothetical protein
MHRILATAAAAMAAIALSGPAYAAPAAKQAKPHATAAKNMAATGTIAKYDEATRTVTLTTSKGDESFVVSDSARVTHSGKAVTDLGTLVGHSAKVHFTQAGDTKTASSIAVAGMSAQKGSKKDKPSTE